MRAWGWRGLFTLLQVGEGRFLRAFLGPMVQAARDRGAWAGRLVVTAPRPHGGLTLAQWIAAGGYRVAVRGPQGTQVSRLALPDAVLDGFTQRGRLLDEVRAAAPLVVVSNTTEVGLEYHAEPVASPVSFPGRLTSWLLARRQAGVREPVCVIPCELVTDNGAQLRAAVLAHAAAWGLDGPGLVDGVAFADTLVDRIVTPWDAPDAGPLDCATEPYTAWFVAGVPEWVRRALPFWEVTWVDDVGPARRRKLRLLNGTHSLLAAFGLLLGLRTVGEALDHPDLGPFVRDALTVEGVGSFPTAERAEAEAFGRATLERLVNPAMSDPLPRLALALGPKLRARWTPILEGWRAEHGSWPPRFAAGVAAYLRLVAGAPAAVDMATLDDAAVVARWRSIAVAQPQAFVRLAAADPAWPVPTDAGLLEMVSRAYASMAADGPAAYMAAHAAHADWSRDAGSRIRG